jgi:hypothetical protein
MSYTKAELGMDDRSAHRLPYRIQVISNESRNVGSIGTAHGPNSVLLIWSPNSLHPQCLIVGRIRLIYDHLPETTGDHPPTYRGLGNQLAHGTYI